MYYNTKKAPECCESLGCINIGTDGKVMSAYKVYHSFIKIVKRFFILSLVLITFIAFLSSVMKPDRQYIPAEHIVKSGECLWNIALKYKPNDVTMDEYMSWIYKHNDATVIYPGDVIIVGV